MLIMQNGQLITEEQAVLSVRDHGVLYGVGAFETLRIYNNYPFLIEDHIKRLDNACRKMQIQIPFSSAGWEEQIHRLLTANNLHDAVIRITVTGGDKDLGLGDTTYDTPNTLIFSRPLPKVSSSGKKLQVLTTPRQAPGGVEMLKTNNYLNSVIARQEVADYPHTEGLFLTTHGDIAEGITSNLFFVKKGEIFTPSLELGILPGITRAFVLLLAKDLGYNVYEGVYSLGDLKSAEEIFLTNAVQEIVPVLECEGCVLSDLSPVASRLMGKYGEYTHHLRSIRLYLKEISKCRKSYM